MFTNFDFALAEYLAISLLGLNHYFAMRWKSVIDFQYWRKSSNEKTRIAAEAEWQTLQAALERGLERWSGLAELG